MASASHMVKDAKAGSAASSLVRIGDKESAYFADGSNIVRVEELPWTPFVSGEMNLDGAVFKLMQVDWERDMYVMILIVTGNSAQGSHFHIGNAHGYIMTGWFDYESGRIFGGDYTMEAAQTQHQAVIGDKDILQLSIIFGGVCTVKDDGTPDYNNMIGCSEIYRLAKNNGAADHIPPPPPGWRSPYEPASAS